MTGSFRFPAQRLLAEKLRDREARGLLRKLDVRGDRIDFSSNDYLGLSRNTDFQAFARRRLEDRRVFETGATGSRLLAGNTALVEETEVRIAEFFGAETSLIFNSGYDANLGLFSCLLGKEDVLIADELVHASIHDGTRLSRGRCEAFRHGDLGHLEDLLKDLPARLRYVAVESVYSMDGTQADLSALATLCERYDAHLIVDEAHATGVFGPGGRGCVVEQGLENRVFARIHTFGKALGCHGAAVAAPAQLRSWLINYARPFVYSTALPAHSLIAMEAALEFQAQCDTQRNQLRDLIQTFQSEARDLQLVHSGLTPIQAVIVPGNLRALATEKRLSDQGYFAKAIRSPTVPAGTERLRICLHAFNTRDQVAGMVGVLRET